jgi:ssDNA-binding replication factor A large subunit
MTRSRSSDRWKNVKAESLEFQSVIEILIKATLIFWDADDSESIGMRDSSMTSKQTVKLKIFKEMYATYKYGRMNCTVTELIVLTFCIVTSTVIG